MRLLVPTLLLPLLLLPVASALVTEIETPPALQGPLAIEVAEDGSVWYTAVEGWALARFDPATNRTTTHPLAAPKAGAEDSLYAIAVGPDAAWTASQRSLHRVDRATGEVRAYALPGESDLSGGVFVADDGGVWASLVTINRLARLDPATGEIRTFDVAFQGGPLAFAPAGAGRAYVGQTYGDVIDALDTRLGTFSTIARGIESPTGIAVDGDALWVGEHGGSSLVRVDVRTGAIERFPTAASPYYPISGPNGISVAPDGSVWFAVHFADRIARFDPATRSLVEYEVPSSPGTNVQHVDVDARGRAWFAQQSTSRIGYALFGNETLEASLPANVTLPPTGSARVAASAGGAFLNATTGIANLTASVQGGEVVLEARNAAPGTHHVLVWRQEGKLFVGRYFDVVVAPAADAPLGAWAALAALAALALARGRR